MNPWITQTIVLAALNLARLTGRGILAAQCAMAALVLAALVGWLPDVVWWRRVASVLVVGLVIVAWQCWCLRGDRRRTLLGLLVFCLGAAAQWWLLPGGHPALAGPWPWLAAFLLLAEPATRGLRWGMGLVGKPTDTILDPVGRGEAIGVLERWIVLVVIAKGHYAAMGFIVAAKALARHKRFETDPEFAEYFLVGTLASVLLALAVAELLRGLGVAG
jgi:hypothetical protein